MPNQTPTAQRPTGQQAPAQLPFNIASRKMSRFSFNAGTTALAAAAPVPLTMIMLPAVGFLSHVNLEVTVTTTAAGVVYQADAPFNLLSLVEFKTAAGNDIVVPVTGYQLFLANKYGCQWAGAPMSDLRNSRQYTATTGVNGGAHFFMPIPLEIDSRTGLGAVPALASNRSYQLQLTLAAISTVYAPTVPTVVSVTITGTAWYWSEPPASTQNGVSQAVSPQAVGTISQWQLETPPLTPGDKYIKSNNVGNVLRTVIFTLRNSSGARIDTNGWPGVSEIYLDNEPQFYLTQNEWEFLMACKYNLSAANKDVALGLDTGVYVLPFFAMAGNDMASDALPRNQYLATLDASQFQIRGTSFGSAVSTLEILTNSVIPENASVLFGG